METTAVIVTYADRYGYVEQVVNRILSFGLYRIIIVNNNSVQKCAENLQALSISNSNISVVNLDSNTGSAYAFNRGIEAAMEDPRSGFIWLIDDDNLPEPDSYGILKKTWIQLSIADKNRKLILSSLRGGRQNYIDAVKKNDPESIIGQYNIFRSFHIKKFFKFKHNKNEENVGSFGEISAAPYGGMFFHRELIDEIGLNDEKYYLYCDDFDFCCRHTGNGGRIILTLESRITDIEKSWNTKGRAVDFIARGDCAFRIYYSVRNRVFLEKRYLVKSWFIYLINMAIYSGVVTILALSRLKFKNIMTYYTAVYHGLTGKMGCNSKYSL